MTATSPTPVEIAEHLALIARQLLELNTKLEILPVIQKDQLEMKRELKMVRGWMDGQEEITASQSSTLFQIRDKLNYIERQVSVQSDKADRIADYVMKIAQQLDGVTSLGQSTFDMATELKDSVRSLLDERKPGVEREQEQATQ